MRTFLQNLLAAPLTIEFNINVLIGLFLKMIKVNQQLYKRKSKLIFLKITE